jgi:hypothetical protein
MCCTTALCADVIQCAPTNSRSVRPTGARPWAPITLQELEAQLASARAAAEEAQRRLAEERAALAAAQTALQVRSAM